MIFFDPVSPSRDPIRIAYRTNAFYQVESTPALASRRGAYTLQIAPRWALKISTWLRPPGGTEPAKKSYRTCPEKLSESYKGSRNATWLLLNADMEKCRLTSLVSISDLILQISYLQRPNLDYWRAWKIKSYRKSTSSRIGLVFLNGVQILLADVFSCNLAKNHKSLKTN
ncbi:uncharacterized protein K441DRAFT_84295 [Cenococcum geophilum 1.58]|uniref:uncharacterized protein n=1 Tax=Cenococcum geophilum 1.58 TaxID=794803 RepID=UPI0035901BA6|nr:hypothetical protein K441DRAFT_84295 [Cenococcum geophilum 1.58]